MGWPDNMYFRVLRYDAETTLLQLEAIFLEIVLSGNQGDPSIKYGVSFWAGKPKCDQQSRTIPSSEEIVVEDGDSFVFTALLSTKEIRDNLIVSLID